VRSATDSEWIRREAQLQAGLLLQASGAVQTESAVLVSPALVLQSLRW
jgi:hypothetical protein